MHAIKKGNTAASLAETFRSIVHSHSLQLILFDLELKVVFYLPPPPLLLPWNKETLMEYLSWKYVNLFKPSSNSFGKRPGVGDTHCQIDLFWAFFRLFSSSWTLMDAFCISFFLLFLFLSAFFVISLLPPVLAILIDCSMATNNTQWQ